MNSDNVPTTDEMDGIFTDEDRLHRYDVYIPCKTCNEWSLTDIRRLNKLVCQACGDNKFDTRDLMSFRTFDPVKAKAKRKNKK